MSSPIMKVDAEHLNLRGLYTRVIEAVVDFAHHPEATEPEKENLLTVLTVLLQPATKQPTTEPPKPARKPCQRTANVVRLPPSA